MADAADSANVRNANALKKQFRSRMLALSFVPEAVKADISRELIDEADLRSDACRTCGSLFTATTSRVALCRQPNVDSIPKRNQKRKHRRSRAQLTLTCTRCSTTFDPVRLPRPRPGFKPVRSNALLGTEAEAPPASTPVEKPKQQSVSSKKHRESSAKTPKGLVLPKLTSRELKGKKTNRLSKLVAAMESTESSTSSNAGSSLGAFLSSL